jgi:hypothetical protein
VRAAAPWGGGEEIYIYIYIYIYIFFHQGERTNLSCLKWIRPSGTGIAVRFLCVTLKFPRDFCCRVIPAIAVTSSATQSSLPSVTSSPFCL